MTNLPNKIDLECYDYKALISQLPVNAELLYDVKIVPYGFLHDVGFRVSLTRNRNGYGRGWDTFKTEFASQLAHISECWQIAAEYGYH